jgi:ferrochelatase
MKKKAVLLLNLGSPDAPTVPAVRRYLREFLMDGRVIDTEAWKRWLIVNAFILPTRPKASAHAYASVWTDRGSPLVSTSQDFVELLSAKSPVPVYLGMRYGNPSTASQVERMRQEGVEEVLLFPLYPHYAMSSYESALVCATDAMRRLAPSMDYRVVQPFFNDPDYIDCLIDQSRPYLDQPFDHLLFSFHGIPEKHLRKGDPSHAHCLSRGDCCQKAHPAHATCYRHQCFETVRAFVEKASLPSDRYSVSFQSRLGRDPWLSPYTDHVLAALPSRGVKRLLVICPAFVTDCLETLEEIAMQGKETFLEAGGEDYAQIPCLNLNPSWVRFAEKEIGAFTGEGTGYPSRMACVDTSGPL